MLQESDARADRVALMPVDAMTEVALIPGSVGISWAGRLPNMTGSLKWPSMTGIAEQIRTVLSDLNLSQGKPESQEAKHATCDFQSRTNYEDL